jgi:hypothetical protein
LAHKRSVNAAPASSKRSYVIIAFIL